ncbi:hypothetical protein [Halobacterium salinarum]|uniref:Uncharacterized protein n=1 Tax=Halobacterium salinarum (strain ATCC 33171 / DSM 3754 / JCM 8978 / NBRC 102687 / NCIMB 764 / 91-R6) TaxID=2597657 RepID=A0A4D6GX07_HALS9|nr:hypothetical protein [Halobacterium salinarum]MDL0144609.1 hypothetical protein [Halobacterium salinarum]QCC45158.1 uncharacterized protein HBSAL_07535 [Halobacterium salinarum]TYO76268.1 hypothetical protein APQ99_01828 [Halobacterium salinarum DSM 3754]
MSRRRSGGVLAATGDVLSAFLSITVVVGLPLSIVNHLLGSPLSTWVVKSVAFVVALGGAYPFVAGDWPLAKLTDFAVAAVLTWIAVAVFVTVGLLAAVDGGLPSDPPVNTAVRLGIVALSFCVAALYVRDRERTHVTDDDAHGH